MNSPIPYWQKTVSKPLAMADSKGLGSTMLHYLAVWQAMVIVHGPVYSKIMLTTRLPGKLTAVHPGEWQEVVAYMSCVEAFVTRFKIKSQAIKALFKSQSRGQDNLNCKTQRIKNTWFQINL